MFKFPDDFYFSRKHWKSANKRKSTSTEQRTIIIKCYYPVPMPTWEKIASKRARYRLFFRDDCTDSIQSAKIGCCCCVHNFFFPSINVVCRTPAPPSCRLCKKMYNYRTHLPFPAASATWISCNWSMPILIRYGTWRLAAIANGSPKPSPVTKERQKKNVQNEK